MALTHRPRSRVASVTSARTLSTLSASRREPASSRNRVATASSLSLARSVEMRWQQSCTFSSGTASSIPCWSATSIAVVTSIGLGSPALCSIISRAAACLCRTRFSIGVAPCEGVVVAKTEDSSCISSRRSCADPSCERAPDAALHRRRETRTRERSKVHSLANKSRI